MPKTILHAGLFFNGQSYKRSTIVNYDNRHHTD